MKKIFLLAIAAFALTSCNNDENYVAGPAAATITATIGESALTRAADSEWTAGDEIGISSLVGNQDGPYINVKYTTLNGDGLFTGKALYFYNNMTLNAYYPYSGSDGTAPGNNGKIKVKTGADNQTADKQPQLDFLWDSKTGVNKADFSASNPKVNFVFAHKMSKVTFKFLSSEAVIVDGIKIAGPVNVKDMVNYTLKGLVLDGTFDTHTGVCAVDAEVGSFDLSIDVKNKVKDNEAVLPLIILPQTLDRGSVQLNIYSDELNDPNNLQHYNCNLAFSNGEIKPGYHYKYTIKVSKVGLIVGEMSVAPWEEKENYMTATIDGENPFK